MKNSIQQILSIHKDQSGILHTANFKIAEWLVNELEVSPETKHEIVHHNPDRKENRLDVIKRFQANDVPSILISPSITEGLDLMEDLARFAIFVKVPFGSLMDQWIKRRQEISNDWYKRQALIDVIQGCGRIVRSMNDKGQVYILDESWGFLYNTMSNNIPVWWKNAYKAL